MFSLRSTVIDSILCGIYATADISAWGTPSYRSHDYYAHIIYRQSLLSWISKTRCLHQAFNMIPASLVRLSIIEEATGMFSLTKLGLWRCSFCYPFSHRIIAKDLGSRCKSRFLRYDKYSRISLLDTRF